MDDDTKFTDVCMRTQRYIQASTLGQFSIRGVSPFKGIIQCRFIPQPLASFTRDHEMELAIADIQSKKLALYRQQPCFWRRLGNYSDLARSLATDWLCTKPKNRTSQCLIWSRALVPASTQFSPSQLEILGGDWKWDCYGDSIRLLRKDTVRVTQADILVHS